MLRIPVPNGKKFNALHRTGTGQLGLGIAT